VRDVAGRFAPGSLTAVIGPNGAGKSTLVKAIAGTLPLAAGRINRGGLLAHELGYLPQAAGTDRLTTRAGRRPPTWCSSTGWAWKAG